MNAADAQQEENGGRIRGGDDGAKQQALQPGEPEQQGGRTGEKDGCENDADCRESDSRGCRKPSI
jgi:hypothetical protein